MGYRKAQTPPPIGEVFLQFLQSILLIKSNTFISEDPCAARRMLQGHYGQNRHYLVEAEFEVLGAAMESLHIIGHLSCAAQQPPHVKLHNALHVHNLTKDHESVQRTGKQYKTHSTAVAATQSYHKTPKMTISV